MLHFEEKGQGQPIVLIHGFGANTASYREWMDILSDSYRTIAVDLKGFGKSPKPSVPQYSIPDQIDCVEQVIDQLDLDDVIVCGQSYGGAVALGLTVRRQDAGKGSISGLVVVDGAAYPQRLPPFFQVFKSQTLAHLSFNMISREKQVEFVLKQCFYDKNLITQQRIAAYADPLKDQGSSYALSQVIRQMLPPDPAEFTDAYRSIRVPVLILWGQQDQVIPIQTAHRLHKDIPHSELIVLDRCGHAPNEEYPVETAGMVRAFIERVQTEIRRPGLSEQ